jgi:hypothetical protein
LPVALAPNASAQPGCTDAQALNFDPDAMGNDGSCLYPDTQYNPIQITELPPQLLEASGLAFFNNQLWLHEDGGNEEHLFSVDTSSGAILQTVTLLNSENLDWEDLATDGTHLYVGDFGNNTGDRKDLRILKIKKSDLTGGTATPEVIRFSFSDQTDFTPAVNANNYDCEAFFFWNDSLHLFSKNWVDFKTRHYILPATPGVHVAQLRDSLEVEGQITAADITTDGVAALLGYNVNTAEVFLWLLFDFPGNRVFNGNKRKISLGNALALSQAEGIAFSHSYSGFICSERYAVLPQKLLKFDIRQYVEPPVSVVGMAHNQELTVFPNPFSDSFHLRYPPTVKAPLTIALLDIFGKTSWSRVVEMLSLGNDLYFNLDDVPLADGIYQIVLQSEGYIYSQTIIKKG